MENQEKMQNSIESPNSPTLGDSKNQSVAKIVALSLIFGLVGGMLGASWLLNSPSLQKQFAVDVGSGINQRVILSEESAVIDVVNKTSPAVVSIVVSKDLSKIPNYGFDPFGDGDFPFFFGGRQAQPSTPNIQQVGAGSGFFVSSDGLILTNRHVVSDEQASYSVLTNDGKTYDATVEARDPVNDIAIVKIQITGAPYLTLADSANLQVGQRVVAIGNSLGQYQNTVTSGIISGIGRTITAGSREGSEQLSGVIQTDAAINPGNSGGPLLNVSSQVIGINTAMDQQGQLVGFAIPSNDAARALDSFKKTGKITRPFLGIRYLTVNKELAESQKLPRDYGALIVRGQTMADLAVLPGSPADKAGLQENDIILEVNGKKLGGNDTLAVLLKNYNIGDTITLKVYSKGNEKEVKVTLEEFK